MLFLDSHRGQLTPSHVIGTPPLNRIRSDAVEHVKAQIHEVDAELRKLEADRNRSSEASTAAEVRVPSLVLLCFFFLLTVLYPTEGHETTEKLAARRTYQNSAAGI